MNYAVIMAGGTGTRLWPMSRKSKPKQLHNFVSKKTLIQETFDRVESTLGLQHIFVSTNPSYAEDIKNQLPNIKSENFIIEPVGRNTAPALAYIAFTIFKRDKDANIATLASDHTVNNLGIFSQTVKIAFKAVDKFPDHLVVVGINPTRPDTGLGYIKMGNVKDKIDGEQIFDVEGFVEKPDLKTAEQYMSSWEYLWNGAYYFFKAKEFLKWLKKYRTELYEKMDEITDIELNGKTKENVKKVKDLFNSLKNEQFENAIIEQKDFNRILVIPADLGWSDIGNWGTLHEVLSNEDGDSMISRGEHIDVGSKGCLVYGSGKMIATLNLKDIVIVDTDDVILIADKNKAQDVKLMIDKLKQEGKTIHL